MSSAPTDPLSSPSYFTSTLETLLDSFHDPLGETITLHDLADAYNTISHQIRSQAHLLLHPKSYPALEPLRRESTRIWTIIRRDIRRCLVNPSTLGHFPASTPEQSISSPSHLSEEHLQFAMDLAVLSQHALRFASNICILPALYSIFTTHDLHGLLDDILMIVATRLLPTPSAQRTHTLIIWLLQTQRLPSDVLEPVAEQIVSALDRGLAGDFGDQAITDSLQTIQIFLTRHTPLFVVPLAPSLTIILDLLLSEIPNIRAQAIVTTGAYIVSKLDGYEIIDSSMPTEDTIQVFVQSGLRDGAHGTCQLGVLQLAVPKNQISPSGDGPVWALLVLASLIVLLRGSIFGQPHSIKFCLGLLAQASRHKRSTVRALQAIVWKCLVWSYFSLGDKARSAAAREQKKLSKLQERAFLVVKQELRCGIGVSLVSALLADRTVTSNLRTEDVNRALSVIKDMVTSPTKITQQQGLLLLKAIMDSERASRPNLSDPRDRDGLLERKLFDGSLLNADVDSLPTMIKSFEAVNFSQVQGLTEDEMADHWESLIEIWGECMKAIPKGEVQDMDDLIDVWRSLLLVQSQLTQERPTGTTSAVASRVASTICRFITQAEAVEVQTNQLSLVNSLWSAVESIFSQPWLSGPAQIVMASLLKRDFLLSHDSVKSAWTSLCAKLVSAGIPALPHILSMKSHRNGEKEMKRQLWMLLARNYQDCDNTQSWQDLISFLLIPFERWTMPDDGYELWEGVLRSSFSLAGQFGLRPHRVIQHLFDRVHDQKSQIFCSTPRYFIAVLAHIDLADEDRLPTSLLSTINDVLGALYPLVPERLTLALEAIRCLESILHSIPSHLLVEGLIPLSKSLCLWLTDDKECLLDSQLNVVTDAIYCKALQKLEDQPPKLDHLLALTNFLASVFSRVTPPATGPIAFLRFWSATYAKHPEWVSRFPENLKTCLVATSCAWSSHLVGSSLSTDSQYTSRVTVTDSQPLGKTNPHLLETPAPLSTSPLAIPTTSMLRPTQGFDDSYMALLSSSPPPFGHHGPGSRAEVPSIARRPLGTSRYGGANLGNRESVGPGSEGMTSLYDPVVTPPRRPPSRRDSIQSLGLSTPRSTLEPSSPTDLYLYGDEDDPQDADGPSLKRRRTEVEPLVPCISKGRKSTSEASSRGVSFLIPGFSSPPRPAQNSSPALPVNRAKTRSISQKDNSHQDSIPGLDVSRKLSWKSRARSPRDSIPPTSSGVKRKRSSSPFPNPFLSSSPPANDKRNPFFISNGDDDDIESWEASKFKKSDNAFPPSDNPHIPTSELDVEEVDMALSFGVASDQQFGVNAGEDIGSRSDISPTRSHVQEDRARNDRRQRRSRTAPIPFQLYQPAKSDTGTGLDNRSNTKRKRPPEAKQADDPTPLHRTTSISMQSRHQAASIVSGSNSRPHPRGPKKKALGLDALESAYAAIAGQGASQIPVQTLMQATMLVNKLGQALTERMSKKIGVVRVDGEDLEESPQQEPPQPARGKRAADRRKGKGKERVLDGVDIDEEGC